MDRLLDALDGLDAAEDRAVQAEAERDALAKYLAETYVDCPGVNGNHIKGPSCEVCDGGAPYPCWIEWAKQEARERGEETC